ncbi:MAG: NUDIX domain-containing protein [Flavobacterium sp.]|nr:NUDIX domain-containing protein [Flavobacterium sp.]
MNYLVYYDEKNQTIIQKRIEKGIWQNLYEFPLLETEKSINIAFIKNNILIENEVIDALEMNTSEIIHKLTHQKLHIKFWKINIKGVLKGGLNLSEIKEYPFPIVIANFIEREIDI